MKYKESSFQSVIEILANDHFTTKNITLNFTNVTAVDGVKKVKAGSPITAAGVVDNTGTADVVGILWKDAFEDRPSVAIITHGFIDKAKAEEASGLTLAVDTWGSDLPMVSWQ